MPIKTTKNVGESGLTYRGATAQFQIMSTNRAFKNWPEIFNHDAVLTSALLDRLLHHAEVCVIEGRSFRAKDQIET